jgi:hypothetical protein
MVFNRLIKIGKTITTFISRKNKISYSIWSNFGIRNSASKSSDKLNKHIKLLGQL